jgi:putative exosortase-associated protein (TIGR04073 family)
MKTMTSARVLIFIACVAFLSLVVSEAHAQTAVRKFGRGLAGMTCGFLEMPGNIVKETREQGAVGVPIGLALGLGMLVARELLYEFVTAPFPAPAGYRPILHPEFPWDYIE